MRQGRVEDLLSREIGLDPASVGSGLIRRAVEARMSARGLDDPGAYDRLLDASAEERLALIEEVVVPESWFFRDARPFEFLQELARDRPSRDPSAPPLRVLSLPCAGGEEPYSIAVALLEAGLPPAQFRIDAVDVSARAIERARRGRYGPNAFRGPPASFRDRYFRQGPEGSTLDPSVRETVRFVLGNLLDPDLLGDQPPYDVIFCRNLLIYLHVDSRKRAMATLERLLAPSGVLFIGHAESLACAASPFVLADDKGSFAYRRASSDGPAVEHRRSKSPRSGEKASARAGPPGAARPPTPRESGAARPPRPAPSAAAVAPPPPSSAPVAAPTPPTLLERASELANRRRYDEAGQLCEQSLREVGPTALAYFLLGIIHQAAGDEARAEACLHKAVYLDGHHDEALLALALIAQRRGDQAAAGGYRRRASRALRERGTR